MSSDSGGGSSSGDNRAEVRYAPYIEEKHRSFLDAIQSNRIEAVELSPYSGQTDIIVEEAFFGANYIISDFPSLYDMFGKFMAGLDIDHLYSQIFEDTVNATEVDALVAAESDLLQDEIEMNILPGYELAARDINSVMSSVYAVEGANIMGDAKIKAMAKFSGELRFRLIPVAMQRWQAHLGWNQNVVGVYAEVMKLYFSARMDVASFNTNMDAKDTLWPFTVLEYERAALGALQGARVSTSNSVTNADGSSRVANVASGALAGASVGSAASDSWWAPIVGAGVGAGISAWLS